MLPLNWCAPTSVTFGAPTRAPSSTSAARAARTAASRSSRHWCRCSSAISTAERFAFRPRPNGAPSPGGLAAWPSAAPLFVGSDGDRITRGTLQYRVLRAFRRAGIEADRARGALVHGLRHTFATELANADVSVYTLMKLLGHESMVTSQRYVTAAGTQTRTAAAQNKLYGLLEQER